MELVSAKVCTEHQSSTAGEAEVLEMNNFRIAILSFDNVCGDMVASRATRAAATGKWEQSWVSVFHDLCLLRSARLDMRQALTSMIPTLLIAAALSFSVSGSESRPT